MMYKFYVGFVLLILQWGAPTMVIKTSWDEEAIVVEEVDEDKKTS